MTDDNYYIRWTPMKDVLPCPFCGSTNIMISQFDPRSGPPQVDCMNCGASGPSIYPGALAVVGQSVAMHGLPEWITSGKAWNMRGLYTGPELFTRSPKK